MKKSISAIFILFYVFLSCSNPNDNTLNFSIDSKPASLFIEIMNLSMNNQIDNVTSNKIDSLLNQPVYTVLTDNVSLTTKNKKYVGKDAYRFALKNLNTEKFRMTSDLYIYWKKWWEQTEQKKLLSFINEININKTDIIKQSSEYVNTYLPSDINTSQHINTFLCLDGNRSSFTVDNMLIMDLFNFKLNINSYTKTFAHELHHIYYRKWLDKRFNIDRKNESEKVLLEYQKKLILEGIAQQINFDDPLDYTIEVKELYFNEELINELSKDWFAHFRNINTSEQPRKDYNKLLYNIWNNGAVEKLERYYKGNNIEALYERRPVVFYYIGFHLYYDIYKNGGKEKLDYVISHPKELLDYYNKLRKENDFIPFIPKDIIEIWKNNFD